MPEQKQDFQGINLVVGLGKTGLSMVRALRKQQAQVEVIDSRCSPPGLDELVTRNMEAGRLTFTTAVVSAVQPAGSVPVAAPSK